MMMSVYSAALCHSVYCTALVSFSVLHCTPSTGVCPSVCVPHCTLSVGVLHCIVTICVGVFILLLLSGERNFGVRFNKTYTVRVPMDIPVFIGSHANFVIIGVNESYTSYCRVSRNLEPTLIMQ